MKKLHLLLFGLLLVHISGAQNPNTSKDTLKVLFVGNSYTYFNNLSHVVSVISDSTSTKLITKKSTAGGASLHEHWNGLRGLETKELITQGDFDVVVLQEHSMGAISQPDSLRKYASKFADLIRSTGAKPYMFQVWAREKVPQYIQELNLEYEAVSKKNDITLVPIGRGWDLARKIRPTAPLFVEDGTHPSPLGTVITAAIFIGVLTGEVPDKVYQAPTIYDQDGESIELVRLDWLDMIFAIKVAKETIDTYWK
ncbi:MAG: hypothetical protein GY816_17605 [Cytophagales bacterium]|nr:hypothetical protein [Cytophagales bacterium]